MTACFHLDGVLYELTIGRKRARVECIDDNWDYEHLDVAEHLSVEVDHCRTIDEALSALGVEVYSP